jgi:hypothetical protein
MNYSTTDAVATVSDTFSNISTRLGVFTPRLILAVIVLVIGWVIALVFGNIVATIVQSVGFDSLSRRIGLTRLLESGGIEKSVSAIIGQIVTWILVLVVFMSAAEVMGMDAVRMFLNSLLNYIPNAISAAATLLIGLILANFLSDTVRHAAQAGGLGHTSVLTVVTRNAIIVFTIVAVLAQLGIASDIMRALLYGLIAMVSLAGGLAFGIGAQGTAKRAMERLETELKSKK